MTPDLHLSPQLKRVAVFCGASTGVNAAYAHAARDLGERLAEADVEVVFGGSSMGLMGSLADAILGRGGRVVGVITRDLADHEGAHRRLSALQVVGSMHERKRCIADQADAFIALPGGAGTLEEIAEQWSWAQMGRHHKPCIILNIEGYYDALRALVFRMVDDQFMNREQADNLVFCESVESALQRLGLVVRR